MSEPVLQMRSQAPPTLRPEMLIGAASPLWGYFAGAAVAGVAWWWMTSWMRPAKPKASSQGPRLVHATESPVAEAPMAAAPVAAAPVVEAPIAEAPVVEALVSAKLPELPVGGEAAPFGPATLKAELLSEAAPLVEAPPAQAAAPAKKPSRAPARKPKSEPAPKPH